ncbi:MAG: zinc-binding alcohol dehydrogenase family protein [Rubrobacter sp.]|nr:zinc-binding alcohol dehydrogenase family protein [Rubrobacter sp.]
MRVARIEEFDGPDVLRVAEEPRPEPGDNEILIEIRSAGINRADVLTRGGGYHAAGQPPIVPGFEGSGIVRGVGDEVEGFGSGDRVFAFGGSPGFYAEYATVSRECVVWMPERLGWDPAAALSVAPLTAFYCLRRLADLKSGETVLVWAAATGVGDAAVQISKSLGATVIATAGTDEKVDWALENGADYGINHNERDVLEETREIVGDAGVAVVLDTVGGRRFGESLKMAGSGGRVVVLANVALEESVIDTRDFYPRNVTIYGFQINNLMQSLGYDPRTDLTELANLAARGALEVHVDAVFTLEGAVDAHRYLEARRNRGKVVIHPGE